ncbi:Methyltransferase-like protein 17, mitochondrial [Desmophyllum pertusum]|uniref:Methyltransferase-like protein 17, mitochondrial n=1 Tax=Desmophyllum pertusum TaxID=174260 RepID=A0A9W9Z3S9_9CNID|nr:Methyltransferase-like protein 17, mitochondrial [Desmophyllum pertusum]
MSGRNLCFRAVERCKSCWFVLNQRFVTPGKVLCSNLSTSHEEPSEDSSTIEKLAYGHGGYDKRDKKAAGLFYLKTLHLPEQLEKNLNNYLKKFPKKIVENDGRKLARHIRNRGRPTEQTWQKYRESKRQRDILAASQVNPDDVLKLENQQGETIFDDSGDISEDEEEESDEQADLTGAVDEQVGSDDTDDDDEKENGSGVETKQTDTNRAPGSNKKVKVITKPRGAEYKLIRYDKRESAAYAASRIPASYGATLRVFHEISRREPDFQPETLLDFGSGSGSATWAAHEKWGDSIREYQCVDVSQDMNDLAEYLLRGGEGLKNSLYIPKVYFKRFLPVSNLISYNVVVASYALSEIPKASLRQMAVRSLWGKTSDFLVIIEHGNSEGFEITAEARNLVLKNGDGESVETEASAGNEFQYLDPAAEEMDDGFVFSPCPHDVKCARSDAKTRDHPCNFEQRVQLAFSQKNTRLKKRGFHTARFSYIVLRKGARDSEEKPWPRVLEPLRLRRRHVICKLCCSSGDLKHKIFTKKKDGDIYKCARHLTKWGDLLPDPEHRERPVKSNSARKTASS